MVASQAVIEQGPDSIVLQLSASMEAHAASGEWERIEEIAARLHSVIMAVPGHQRREVLLAAKHSMEKVQTLAHYARSDVAEKLSAMRRGKDATRAYAGAD